MAAKTVKEKKCVGYFDAEKQTTIPCGKSFEPTSNVQKRCSDCMKKHKPTYGNKTEFTKKKIKVIFPPGAISVENPGEEKREVFTLAIPKKSKISLEAIDAAGKGIGDNRVEFCMKAIETFVGMDVPIIKHLESMAEKLNTRLPIVIQNLLIERLASDSDGENACILRMLVAIGIITEEKIQQAREIVRKLKA